jgi:hypothetical protein
MVNLNPDQFFHGTAHDIQGDTILPADKAGKEVSEHSLGDPGTMSEGSHAFAIRNWEGYAWHAAKTFHDNSQHRARVYEVEPAKDMEPGPWHKDHPDFIKTNELDVDEDWLKHPKNREAWEKDVAKAKSNHQDEYGSRTGFKIKQRHDIMPGHQGTFPEINWHHHKLSGARGTDPNHPSDEQVRYGVHGHESAQHKALKDNEEIDAERHGDGRQGRSFREFMEGKPVQPNHGHPTLF